MSKKSIARQCEREQAQRELSRRLWMMRSFLGGSILALGGACYFAYSRFHVPSFEEAYDDSFKRQRWLDGLESRPYATKIIATDATLDELKRAINYAPPRDPWGGLPFADTRALQEENVARGSPSMLYVYESCFDPLIARFKRSLGIIVENVIERHELLHADHFYSGIPGYPPEWFLRPDKEINRALFMAVTEIVCHRSEYDALNRIAAKDAYLSLYQEGLKKLVAPYFLVLPRLTDNQEMIQKAKRESWF